MNTFIRFIFFGLAGLFLAVVVVLFVKHSGFHFPAKKTGWTVSLRQPESKIKSLQQEPEQVVTDEELAQTRQRLERRAWEVAQQRENEAAKREGREPVQIIVGSDLPVILKYYENQNVGVGTAAPSAQVPVVNPVYEDREGN